MGRLLTGGARFAEQRRSAWHLVVILSVGTFVAFGDIPPRLTDAAVDVTPVAAAGANQNVMKELLAAFDRAETAVQQADIDTLMDFYAKGYNYHGLKRTDVRRVWSEVFAHYGGVNSKHVFTDVKVTKAGRVQKAFVTCTGGLYGTDKSSGASVTIDSWVNEVHFLVKEPSGWRFLGNAEGTVPAAPPASAPHHPLF